MSGSNILKNGFLGPKSFRGFQEMGPWGEQGSTCVTSDSNY